LKVLTFKYHQGRDFIKIQKSMISYAGLHCSLMLGGPEWFENRPKWAEILRHYSGCLDAALWVKQ